MEILCIKVKINDLIISFLQSLDWTKKWLVNQITSSVVPAITQGPVSPIHQGVGTPLNAEPEIKLSADVVAML